MGIFDPGYVWPGDQIDPTGIDDPLNYDSGGCGVILPEDELWAYIQAFTIPGLGLQYSAPAWLPDGSISCWLYAWMFGAAGSRRAYITNQEFTISEATGSGIGGYDFLRRGLQYQEIEFPPGSGQLLKFSWGANPADKLWAYEHSYYLNCGDLYGCYDTNNEEQSIGFWRTQAEVDQIRASWQSGIVTDCLFVANVGLYADRFFFPAAWSMAKPTWVPPLWAIGAAEASAVQGAVIAAGADIMAGTFGARKHRRRLNIYET
jgi:hypothetical protein